MEQTSTFEQQITQLQRSQARFEVDLVLLVVFITAIMLAGSVQFTKNAKFDLIDVERSNIVT